jgi:predicted nucleic acid-binding protein
VRFWDSSALVPLLVKESSSPLVAPLVRSDAEVVLWWASPVECRSAVHRRRREGRLSTAFVTGALGRLAEIVEDADVVEPTAGLRDRAGALLATHPLRASDALQLAAALAWCDDNARGRAFVCLDERLADAARREGFDVLPR